MSNWPDPTQVEQVTAATAGGPRWASSASPRHFLLMLPGPCRRTF